MFITLAAAFVRLFNSQCFFAGDDYREAIRLFDVDLATNSIGTNTCSIGMDCDITGDYGVTASVIDAIVAGGLGQ